MATWSTKEFTFFEWDSDHTKPVDNPRYFLDQTDTYYASKGSDRADSGFVAKFTNSHSESTNYYCVGSNGNPQDGKIYGTSWEAQSFTTGNSSVSMTSVYLPLLKSGTISGTLEVDLYSTDGSGHPDTKLADGSISIASIGTTIYPSWEKINLSYNMSANTKYAIVLHTTSGNIFNYVSWQYAGHDAYSVGERLTSGNSGSTWPAQSTYDHGFVINDDTGSSGYGTIARVEFRVKTYTDNVSPDDKIGIKPKFSGSDGTEVQQTMKNPAAWHDWIDMTIDTNSFPLTGSQNYISGDNVGAEIRANDYKAQTFTPTSNTELKYVYIKMSTTGSPPNDLTVEITGVDGSGHPNISDSRGSTTIDKSNITSTPKWILAYFSSAISLTASTKYAIVCKTTGGDISNYFNWRRDSVGATYGGGNYEYSSDGGSLWTADTDSDLMFVASPNNWTWDDLEKNFKMGFYIRKIGAEDAFRWYQEEYKVHYILAGAEETHGPTDLAKATSTIVVEAKPAISDTAKASDALTMSADRVQSDLAKATDSISLKVFTSLADVARATDSVSFKNLFDASDTARATDSIITKPLESIADIANVEDSLISSAERKQADTARATDSILNKPLISLSDTARATDSIIEKAFESLTDLAKATDSIISSAQRSQTDLAKASDSITSSAQRSQADIARATDSIVEKAMSILSDTARATDLMTYVRLLYATLSDTARASDSVVTKPSIFISDLAKATDSNILGVSVLFTDLAKASDADALKPFISLTEIARATDTKSAKPFISLTETARATESEVESAQRQISDIAKATDSLISKAFEVLSDLAKASDSEVEKAFKVLSDLAKASDSMSYDVTGEDTHVASDTARATDDVITKAFVQISDLAKASDLVSFKVFTTFTDLAKASDASVYKAYAPIADLAKASDSLNQKAMTVLSDLAKASDERNLKAYSVLVDLAKASDELTLKLLLIISDLAKATDVESTKAMSALTDSAHASLGIFPDHLTLTDSAHATVSVSYSYTLVEEEYFHESSLEEIYTHEKSGDIYITKTTK